ncbi:UNVERIFIED_CONTAM: hypothetical protein GTU68_030468 [Idotea baltica]|nr:hypothetical protein [Idotea baltica]
MVQLSTGDMLREARTSGTEMGNMVAGVMDRGELVTDKIVIGLIREKLEAGGDHGGFIFDGFPRTLAQADALGNLLTEMNHKLDHVIELEVNDDVLVERILGRAGADDNEESLKIRLMAYYKQTSPLLGYYYAKGYLTSVDGLGTMDEVASEISGVLG